MGITLRRGATPPIAQVHPAHLSACLPRLSGATIRRLQQCRRLDGTLGELLATRNRATFGPQPEILAGPARLALADCSEILRAATTMGAIWHAAAVRLCISSGAVAALVEGIGAEARGAALRHAALGVADPEPVTPWELAAAIADTADACLGAWLATLPAGVRGCVLLKLPPREPDAREASHEKNGAIIAAAVRTVLGEAAEADAGH